MEDFNFSSLTPIQQGTSAGGQVSLMTAPPLIIPAHGGGHFTSPVVATGKEEDTTMYITVDTGPPSNMSLINCSPPYATSPKVNRT